MMEPAPAPDGDISEPFDQQIVVTLDAPLLERIKDYRHGNRYSSQSAAVRRLLLLGLRAAAWEAKKLK